MAAGNNSIKVEEISSPRFIYMGSDLRIEGEFPGTRLTPKFKFTYRPWDFGQVMSQTRSRIALNREHGKELAKLQQGMADAESPAERERIAQLVADEQQVLNETVAFLLDCEAIAECVIDHDIVDETGMKVDLRKLENIKRLPHSVVRFMGNLISETVGAPPLPTGAINMVGKALGK